ncbi:hypothetical protein LPN01_11015 [Sphingomonas sp. A2-49]|uniref:hypothetical protein n=1 Tax=Sphingomonas sp. A2-49 TaxID=1391375 RepID=UPI0021D157D5|nr:hypothetical protein [Sphingomonas sp. A2-49]MCU6454608.1 hypothetical protein [Sphingomonas sp. A2-49]
MPFEPTPRALTGFAAAALLAGLAVIAASSIRTGADAPSGQGDVRIVTTGASPAPSPPATVPPLPPAADLRSGRPEDLTAALVKQFPAIREAQIVCERGCKLVAALGDQGLTPTPFDGNLQRFLTDHGYRPSGDLVIDQPGDNDTLLTIPLAPPSPPPEP